MAYRRDRPALTQVRCINHNIISINSAIAQASIAGTRKARALLRNDRQRPRVGLKPGSTVALKLKTPPEHFLS